MNLSRFFTKYSERQSHMNKINGNLWLGSIKARRYLKEEGISVVVSVMTKFERELFIEGCLPDGVTEYEVDLDDSPSASLTESILRVKEILDQHSEPALIHCVAGRSRSASMVIGYFMLKDNLSYSEAVRWIRKSRPCIAPNPGFRLQLEALMGRHGHGLHIEGSPESC